MGNSAVNTNVLALIVQLPFVAAGAVRAHIVSGRPAFHRRRNHRLANADWQRIRIVCIAGCRDQAITGQIAVGSEQVRTAGNHSAQSFVTTPFLRAPLNVVPGEEVILREREYIIRCRPVVSDPVLYEHPVPIAPIPFARPGGLVPYGGT